MNSTASALINGAILSVPFTTAVWLATTFPTHSYRGCWESTAKKTYSPVPASFPNVDTRAALLPLPM